jgi:hypothetical protein
MSRKGGSRIANAVAGIFTRLERGTGAALVAAMAVLAWFLRRGKHRAWRKEQDRAAAERERRTG